MCGIVGYTGSKKATEVVLSGLRKLEYRGYDSAGIAYIDHHRLNVVRAVGRVDALAEKLSKEQQDAHTAIGHTRWATHGRPNELNAHPHCDLSGRIAVVHNGIVENYTALRKELQAEGAKFLSETDTEVAAVLIGKLYQGDLMKAVERAIERIEGTFAFAVISLDHPGLLVGARRGSPLAVGVIPNGGGMLLASDAMPMIAHTRHVLYMDDDQVVALEAGKLTLRKNGVTIDAQLQEIKWTAEETERGGYAHYMLKEIHEQPGALRRLAAGLVANPGSANGNVTSPQFNLPDMNLSDDELRKVTRVVICGQGTAFHAGLVGRNMIERCARIPVSVEYGSDFRYRDPVLDPTVLVITVSQSGETADTLGAVRMARERGCKTIGVLNTVGSTIARESNGAVYMHVGPEIGVASTKAFTG